jgi:transposase-like protein
MTNGAIAEAIICKYCSSLNTVKYGTFKGTQYHWCKDCKRKFVPNEALPKMKTPINLIADAVDSYFGGMPLDAIQRNLGQQYNTHFSESGIYYWIIRFSKDAIEQTKDFKPEVGDEWIADETGIRVGNRSVWFWDIIDAKSRYLLASRISISRGAEEAEALVRQASERAGKIPKRIITDKMGAYLIGIERAFGMETKHIQSRPFTSTDSTNIIERFHGTLKDRTKVIRGFKNMDTARLLTQAWLVHYNFFKEHTSLGDIPPAQSMGMPVPIRNWKDVVAKGRVMPSVLERKSHITGVKLPPKRKRKHPKRRPEALADKTYYQATISQVRL